MLNRLLKILGFLLLVAFLIITFAFSINESKDVVCEEIYVSFEGNQLITLDKEEITKLVYDADKELNQRNFNLANTEFIETELEKNPTIWKAEVYKKIIFNDKSYKGILGVKIKFREPLVRIMNNNQSYYLDCEGFNIPVSSDYSAKTIVVTGNVEEEFCKGELLPLINYIKNNSFWKSQFDQIHITNEKEIILSPLVGDLIVDFGEIDKYEDKLRNLQAFYMQILANNNWNKYKRINLKFENQVIGIKR